MSMNSWQEGLFWLGMLVVFFILLYLLSPILLPFVAGGIVAYFLDPAVVWLTGWRLPRWLAATMVLVVFALVLALLIALIVPLVRLQAGELIEQMPALFQKVQNWLNETMAHAARTLPPDDFKKLQTTLGSSLGDLLSWSIGQVQSLLTSGLALANILSLAIITPVVAFFLLRDWDRIIATVDAAMPRDHLVTIREQARQVDLMLGGYMRGQLLVCLGLGIFYAIALSFAGLEFGLIVGILTGVLAFIPYIGYAVGFVLAVGLALLQFGWGMGLVWVLVIFGVGEILESSVLSPKLVGERVRLHPVWVIFALLAFGSLFGFLGVLIALPAAAVTGVLVRFAMSRYRASALYRPAAATPLILPRDDKQDAAQ